MNNNEIGIHVDCEQEPELYRDTYEEAQRLIRISEEVRLAADKVDPAAVKEPDSPVSTATKAADNVYAKLTTSKLAKALGIRTGQLNEKLMAIGFLERDGNVFKLTDKGKAPTVTSTCRSSTGRSSCGQRS